MVFEGVCGALGAGVVGLDVVYLLVLALGYDGVAVGVGLY